MPSRRRELEIRRRKNATSSDVVFVTVRQQQCTHMLAVFFEEREVRRDDIDPEQLRLGKHHARIDYDDVVTVAKGHDVHAELAEPAERNDLQFFI